MKSLVRRLTAQPMLTSIIVGTIAIGIGAASAMFAFTYGTVIRGLDVQDPERVVAVELELTDTNSDARLTLHDLADLNGMPELESAAAFTVRDAPVETLDGSSRLVSTAAVTPSALELLEVAPVIGRLFDSADALDGAHPVVLLRASIWREWFGEDPDILGSSVRVDGVDRTVVGVLPSAFGFPWQESLWVPMNSDEGRYLRGEGPRVSVVGKLASGTSLTSFRGALSERDARLTRLFPAQREALRTVADVYTVAQIGPETVVFMKTMLGAVLLVLVIACVNVASIVMSRTTARGREVAVRSALGGAKSRLVASLLADTMIQAALGGGLGLALAQAATARLNALILSSLGGNPFYWIDVSVTPATLALTLGLIVLATLAAGLLPAIRTTAVDPAVVLRDESRGSSSRGFTRTMRRLVVGEVALSVALMAITGVMVKSVAGLRNRDWGFDPNQVLVARYSPPAFVTPSEESAYWRTVLQAVQGAPAVEAASVTTALPLDVASAARVEAPSITGAAVEDLLVVRVASVGSGFFSTLGIRADGRDFADLDRRESEPVVIINQSLSDQVFGSTPALGSVLRLTSPLGGLEPTPRRVVGVVPDLGMGGPRDRRPAGAYVPLGQSRVGNPAIVARLRPGSWEDAADQVRRAVRSADPSGTSVQVTTMAEHLSQRSFFYYLLPLLLGGFGLVAFGLAMVGVFGITAYSVAIRRGEFAIRLALGARPSRVRMLVLGGAARQAIVGVAAGLILAALMAGGLTRMIVNVNPRDPKAFGLAALVVLLAALAAALPSSLRSGRQDPSQPLRGG